MESLEEQCFTFWIIGNQLRIAGRTHAAALSPLPDECLFRQLPRPRVCTFLIDNCPGLKSGPLDWLQRRPFTSALAALMTFQVPAWRAAEMGKQRVDACLRFGGREEELILFRVFVELLMSGDRHRIVNRAIPGKSETRKKIAK